MALAARRREAKVRKAHQNGTLPDTQAPPACLFFLGMRSLQIELTAKAWPLAFWVDLFEEQT